jgi:hypothetical protein
LWQDGWLSTRWTHTRGASVKVGQGRGHQLNSDLSTGVSAYHRQDKFRVCESTAGLETCQGVSKLRRHAGRDHSSGPLAGCRLAVTDQSQVCACRSGPFSAKQSTLKIFRRSSSQKLQSIVDSLLLQIPPATTPNAVIPYYWRHIPRPPP